MVVPEQVPVASVQATEHCVAETVRPSPATDPLVSALTGFPATPSVIPAAEASEPVLFRLTYTLSVSPGAILPVKLLKPTPTSGVRVRLRLPEVTASEPVAVADSPAYTPADARRATDVVSRPATAILPCERSFLLVWRCFDTALSFYGFMYLV